MNKLDMLIELIDFYNGNTYEGNKIKYTYKLTDKYLEFIIGDEVIFKQYIDSFQDMIYLKNMLCLNIIEHYKKVTTQL